MNRIYIFVSIFMKQIEMFNCSKCGLCCQSVGILVEYVKQKPNKNPQKTAKILQKLQRSPHKYDESGRWKN